MLQLLKQVDTRPRDSSRLQFELLLLSVPTMLEKNFISFSSLAPTPFLPPANEVWGNVIFSVACVQNSVHGGGGFCLSACSDTTPLGPDTPSEQTPRDPCPVHAERYSHQAGGMHPTGMQSCFYLFCNYFHISTKTFLGICLLSTVLNQSPFLGVLFLDISKPVPIPGRLVSRYF